MYTHIYDNTIIFKCILTWYVKLLLMNYDLYTYNRMYNNIWVDYLAC